MSMFRHILFPVDFSDRCKAIRQAVLATARQCHASVTLLHTVEMPPAWYGGIEGLYCSAFNIPALKEDALQRLDAFFECPDPSIDIKSVVMTGDPADHIVSFTERNHADLIMMPTHGYGVFRRLLLGSVAAKILHDAKCAVWTSTHCQDPELASHIPARNVICAVDIAPESVCLIRHAAAIAGESGAKLRLVHAVGAVEANIQPYEEMDFLRFLFHAGRDGIAKLQQEAGTDLEVCVKRGSVSPVVREAAEKTGVDLVVIGRGRQHRTLGRLRSNAYAIIRDSPCPVLSF